MKGMTEGQCPFGFGTDPDNKSALSAGERYMGLAQGLTRDALPELVRESIPAGAAGQVTGRCLCGKISFRINRPVEMVFADHDEVSRRRSGGVSLTIMVRANNTTFHGWGHLVHYPVSDRESTCFCRACGTPMLSYYLAPQQMAGMAKISAGAVDNSDGLRLAADISTDTKPAYYTFEGERRSISSDELSRMFG